MYFMNLNSPQSFDKRQNYKSIHVSMPHNSEFMTKLWIKLRKKLPCKFAKAVLHETTSSSVLNKITNRAYNKRAD